MIAANAVRRDRRPKQTNRNMESNPCPNMMEPIGLMTQRIQTIDEARSARSLAPRFGRVIQLLQRCGFDFNRASVCDVGCNLGVLSYWLKRRFPSCDVHACDNAPQLLPEHSPHFDYRVADLARGFPFEDECMDAILAVEIIEHMVDTDFFLDECLRILKPGGYLALTTPNICMLRNRIRVPLGVHPRAVEYRNVIHHVRFYTEALMKQHLADRRFVNIRVTCVNMLPQRWIVRSGLARRTSDWLSDRVPGLGSNLVALARRQA